MLIANELIATFIFWQLIETLVLSTNKNTHHHRKTPF